MARRIVKARTERYVTVTINNMEYSVPSNITILKALELLGFSLSDSLCRLGGCYSCLVDTNRGVVRACVTPVSDGLEIYLDKEVEALRIVHGPQPHMVGGKATPWWIRGHGYVEVAIWLAGCNLRCPQCQNYNVTYDNSSKPVTPMEAAEKVVRAKRLYGVDRIAVSGGEPTINRRWLLEFYKICREMDPDVRLHLDSNGTILTRDYIDRLVEAGVTDIGVEPKGIRQETFKRITGIEDEGEIKKYIRNQWQAIKYISERYRDQVFLGVGIPYNRMLIGLEEIREIGRRLAEINPEVQVVVLDYFPAFRNRELERPSPAEMLKIKETLNRAGLKTVIVQTSMGHIGP